MKTCPPKAPPHDLIKANLKRSFTLIELLIVIAILGGLAAAVLVAINPNKRVSQAQAAIIQTDFSSMRNAIDTERVASQRPLGQITGNYWSAGSCQPPTKATDDVCVNQMNASWQKITQKNMPKDPWGNPYLLDENELEGGACGPDGLQSVGPDHISGGEDDSGYQVPTAFC